MPGSALRVAAAALAAALFAGCSSHSTPPIASNPMAHVVSVQGQGNGETTLTYLTPTLPDSFPWSMVQAADGSIWFGDWADTYLSPAPSENGRIGVISPTGSIAEFEVGPPTSGPILSTFGPDGNLWFSEFGNGPATAPGALGNITLADVPTTYALNDVRKQVPRFAASAGGNLWYTLYRGNKIAEITPAGRITEIPVPPAGNRPAVPHDITVGPDGALWFTEYIGNAIARMTLDGTITNVYDVGDVEAAPRYMVNGSDGGLWISENGSQAFGDSYTPSQIVRMSATGQVNRYPLPPNAMADYMRPATGGVIFADLGTLAVGLMDYSGNTVEYPVTNIQTVMQAVDGSYYFTDPFDHQIGHLTLGKKGIVLPQTIALAPGATQLAAVAVAGDRGPYSASTSDSNCATVAPINGFPLNFTVTAVAPGSCTLMIKGKGKAMTAQISIAAAATVRTQSKHAVRKGGAIL